MIQPFTKTPAEVCSSCYVQQLAWHNLLALGEARFKLCVIGISSA